MLESFRGERLGQLVGHADPVLALVFSNCGETVTVSTDRTFRTWDIDQCRETGNLRYTPSDDIVDCAALSQDARYAAVCCQGARELHLWDRAKGRELWSVRAHDGASIRGVALDPDGRRIVTGGGKNSVRLWNVADKRMLYHLETESEVFCVAFNTDAWLFAAGCRNGTVRLWRTEDGRRIHLWKAPCRIASLAICPGDQYMAAGLIGGRICIWNLLRGRPSRILSGHIGPVSTMAFSPDGCYLTSGSMDQTVQTWQLLYEIVSAAIPERVCRLLNGGADVHVAAADGTTLLDRAIVDNRTDLVNLLLVSGADPVRPDQNGFTSFMIAVRLGRDEIVRQLLDKGVDIKQATHQGLTPLLMASEKGLVTMVELLLDRGASIRAVQHELGLTALAVGVIAGHRDVVEQLLARGAEVDATASHGHTPPMYAARLRDVPMVALLLSHGTNPGRTNDYGETALAMALSEAHREVAALHHPHAPLSRSHWCTLNLRPCRRPD